MDSMSIIPAGQVGDTEKIDQTHRIRHLNHQELFGLKRSRSSNSSLSRMGFGKSKHKAKEQKNTNAAMETRRNQGPGVQTSQVTMHFPPSLPWAAGEHLWLTPPHSKLPLPILLTRHLRLRGAEWLVNDLTGQRSEQDSVMGGSTKVSRYYFRVSNHLTNCCLLLTWGSSTMNSIVHTTEISLISFIYLNPRKKHISSHTVWFSM